MENINITPIIEAVIALIGIVITSFIIPYIKTKMTANQFSYLEGIVKTATEKYSYSNQTKRILLLLKNK